MAVKATAVITISCYRDVESVTRYYKLQASTAAAPSKPTAKPPSEWTDSEPSYTSGSTNTLYFCDLTVFSNGEWSYSTVSKSSSYEAAKEAYNKAVAAQNTANSANGKIDDLEIGGRNLFRFEGFGENEAQLPDYNNLDSFKQFNDCLTFDAKDTVGEEYTISFWAKSPNGSTKLQLYNSNGKPRYFYINNTTLDSALSTEWKYYTHTFVNTDKGETYTGAVYNRIEIYAPNQMGVLVKKIKIEKGNKATDWTPAPEDTDEKIEQNTSDILTSMNNFAVIAENLQARIDVVNDQIVTISNKLQNLVVDKEGASLMEQSGDGWIFSMANTIDSIHDAANKIEELIANTEAQGGDISDMKIALQSLTKLNNYVRITTDGDQPLIELGDATASKLQITNTEVRIMNGNHVVTRINTKLCIEDAEIEHELQVGEFVLKKRSNGNSGFIWRGNGE